MQQENQNPNKGNGEGAMDENRMTANAFNIMYDKRVFRGNTHGMKVLRGGENTLTPAQRDELRFKAEREKKKFEMIKN
jgi:hypothetical protein